MAAAPEVPAVGGFVVSLSLLLLAFFLLAFRHAVYVVGYGLLLPLAKIFPSIFGIRAAVEDGIDGVVNYLAGQLASWQLHCDHAASAVFHSSDQLAKEGANAMVYLAQQTVHGFGLVARVVVPAAISTALAPEILVIKGVQRLYSALHHTTIPNIRKSIATHATTAEHAVTHTAGKVAKLAIAVPVPIPGTIPLDWSRIRDWAGHQLDRVNQRLSTVEKALGVGALAGVIVGVIARTIPGFGCQNNKTLSKAVCGVPVKQFENLLADLLLGATAIFGTLSLIDLAKGVQAIIGGTESEVAHFWRVDVTHTAGDRQLGQPAG